METVEVNDTIYGIDINYEGESDIYDKNENRINDKIDGGLYYEILAKAKRRYRYE